MCTFKLRNSLSLVTYLDRGLLFIYLLTYIITRWTRDKCNSMKCNKELDYTEFTHVIYKLL